MAKLALCVPASAAHSAIQAVRRVQGRALFMSEEVIQSVLNSTNLSMQDRATCETDPSFLQLIPYIMVASADSVYRYSRGKAGGEDRLFSKLSIGLGGHVDSLPESGQSLAEHLHLEAARELQEEVELDADPKDLTVVGILVDASTSVDEVHLGVLMQMNLAQANLGNPEEGVIEDGQMVAFTELGAVYPRLENWSKLALQALV